MGVVIIDEKNWTPAKLKKEMAYLKKKFRHVHFERSGGLKPRIVFSGPRDRLLKKERNRNRVSKSTLDVKKL